MSRAGKRLVELDEAGKPIESDEEREWEEEPSHTANRAERRADAMRVLDVGSNDDASAVKQAYRKLALRHHPDKHRGDPEAERKFKEIVRAYDTLTREYGLMGDGASGGAFQDRFENAADMRDFAASFFESFFFGGGGLGGGRGMFGRRGGRDAYDDTSSQEYDSEDDSLHSLDDDDDDDDYTDDDYTDDDEEYTDLHNFFGSEPPPGWGPRDMPGKWFGRPSNSQGGSSAGRTSMTDDQLFEHLEQMRKEAARYAAELAKQENEARRANEPLEKLQRPTMVSRTDDTITLNLSRAKSTTQNLPQDRCWELSMKKEKEQNYSVYDTVKGTCVVTVSDLLPGTKYSFKARVGRVDESTGEVTEWGPFSVESMYATSGKTPVGNSGKQVEGKVEDVIVEAGMGKKAKKRAAKEQAAKEERERAAVAEKQGGATSAADEAAARQAALRKAAEEAAEREMAEMEEIRKRVEAAKKPDTTKPAPSAGEGISKKAAQRKKKKERAKAEELAKMAGYDDTSSLPTETDEELARRLQAEEAAADARYQQQLNSGKPPVPAGPPPSWAAAPAMRMPARKPEAVQQSGTRAPAYGAPQPPQSAPPPGQSRIPVPRLGEEQQAMPPLPPGPRPGTMYSTAPPVPTAPPPGSTPPQGGAVWGGSQSTGVRATSTWGETRNMAPAPLVPPVQTTPQRQPPTQPASWSPANSNWQPMGQGSGMGGLPVDYGFPSDAQRLPPSPDLFSAGLERNWAPPSAPAPHWSSQSTWNDGSVPVASSADWGLGGLGVSADLSSGAPTWSAFGGTSPSTRPGVWSNPTAPNDLSVDVSRLHLGGAHQGAPPRSPGTPDGDPNLIDSSLLSFLG